MGSVIMPPKFFHVEVDGGGLRERVRFKSVTPLTDVLFCGRLPALVSPDLEQRFVWWRGSGKVSEWFGMRRNCLHREG